MRCRKSLPGFLICPRSTERSRTTERGSRRCSIQKAEASEKGRVFGRAGVGRLGRNGRFVIVRPAVPVWVSGVKRRHSGAHGGAHPSSDQAEKQRGACAPHVRSLTTAPRTETVACGTSSSVT